MRINIHTQNIKLTRSLKRHAQDKLARSLIRVFDRPAAHIEIELRKLGEHRDGRSLECRVTLFMTRGQVITITEVDDNLHKAIDRVHDRLLVQVKRQRQKNLLHSKAQKHARTKRYSIAEKTLSAAPEAWEQELEAYENSQVTQNIQG
jgi:ribosomal subunit interface protein